MADFTAVLFPATTPEPVLGDEGPSVVLVGTAIGNLAPDPTFFQRIYDSSVGYVYYTQGVVNPTPDVADTTPNHTNNLVAATHEIIKEN